MTPQKDKDNQLFKGGDSLVFRYVSFGDLEQMGASYLPVIRKLSRFFDVFSDDLDSQHLRLINSLLLELTDGP